MINENIAKPMHPADIKAEIQKAGTSQAEIARELDVSKTVINNVIYGRMTSRRIAECIAEKIKKTLDEIWPDKYTEAA